MVANAIDVNLGRHAVALAKREWGQGTMQPIWPMLSALLPLEPATERQRRWHVVQTHAQQEGLVEKELNKLKLDAYCPREPKSVRVNACKHRTVKRPILVGYVFAGFDPEFDRWEAIRDVRGVMRLIMVAERPLPVGDSEMERIRMKEAEYSGGRAAKRPPIQLESGILVKVLEPFCFCGLFGFITGIDHVKREVAVEIDIFGRMVPLRLTPEQVEVV